jgi:4-amino-4-deoxy-L-arabinose transferase-like glycosyltransferase
MRQDLPALDPPRLRGASFAAAAVLLLALVIRGGFLLATPGAFEADTDGYRRLAENLVRHGTFGSDGVPTAYRPPLYPLMLAGCVALGDYDRAALGLLHVVLGVAMVFLVWRLGANAGLSSSAVLAALLVALDPILLMQSAQVMTETLATFLTTAGLAALLWTARRPTAPRAALAGVMLGLGVLCRPTLLLWAILVAVVFAFYFRGMPGSQENSRRLTAAGRTAETFRLPLAFVLGVLFVLSSWTIRNQLQFGRPIVTTTHGGYTMFLANNPEFYEWLGSGRWGSVWRAERFDAAWNERRLHDELESDRLAYREAWQTIRQAPGTFCYACLVRLGRFWSPLPHQVVADETAPHRLSRYLVALWYAAEFSLAAIGIWSWRKRQERILSSSAVLFALLLLAALLAAHAVYWTDMRMRGPIMPLVALAAAVGAMKCLAAASTRRESRARLAGRRAAGR